MFRWYLSAAMLLGLSPFLLAQDTSTTTTSSTTTTTTQDSTVQDSNTQKPASPNKPSGTKVVGHDRDTIVAPERTPVKVDANVVKAAQTELQSRGYNPGPLDGVAGPQTRSAVTKFQGDQGIPKSGTLDATTLAKLNVGGTKILSAAPSDLARGGKAAGHDIKEGHPVDAGKAAAAGSENFGKKVAKGSKSLAVRGVEKVGHGISSIGNSVEDKAQGGDSGNSNKQQDQSNSPQQ